MNKAPTRKKPRVISNRPALTVPHYREIDKEKGCPYKQTENRGLYFAWYTMLSRCYCEGHREYHSAGALGVTVCREWQSFGPFVEWANGAGYGEGLCLIRKELKQGYSPENCRWVDRRTACRNQRRTTVPTEQIPAIVKRLARGGITQAELARELGLSDKVLSNVKFSHERAEDKRKRQRN